jgi:GAF domain-containing protein
VAEALAPGVPSIAGDLSFGIRGSGTVDHLERTPEILLQRDLLGVQPAPAADLVERYGARAQMLAPLVQDGRLVGIVSVHHSGTPRDWTPAEVASLETAVGQIRSELGL